MARALLLLGLAALIPGGCAPYHADVSGEQLLADATHDDGDGVDGDADACPRAREDRDGFEDGDGCPDVDNDADGFVDAVDACPDEAGGPRSTDGCVPFIDEDADEVEDSVDKCPKRPETVNGHRDDDGCPDVAVAFEGDLLVFGEPVVFFAPGASELAEGASLALNEVAWLLKATPAVQQLEIGAHVEVVGNARTALKLSEAQALAVRAYLVEKGVPEDKLVAKGYGLTQPKDKARTEEAHAANRRVELRVTKRAE